MLRVPVDEVEQSTALSRLRQAHGLMSRALTVLDGTTVATDCDAHLDQALHHLSAAIADVEAGKPIFTAARGERSSALEPGIDDTQLPVEFADNPWSKSTVCSHRPTP